MNRDNDSTVEIRATASGEALLRLLEAAARIDGASIHCVRAEPEPAWDAAKACEAYFRGGLVARVLVDKTGLCEAVIRGVIYGGRTPTADEARKLNRALGLGGAS